MLDKNDLKLIKEDIDDDIQFLKEKVGRITKANSEDIIALNNEIDKIKSKQVELENRIKELQKA